MGIRINALSSYYHDGKVEDSHTLVVNYSGLTDEALSRLEAALRKPSVF